LLGSKKVREKMGYPSNLKDKEWALIEHNFKNGNRAKHDKRTLVNAILYVVRTGCQWRWLPQDFPNWKTVHTFYRRMSQNGTWDKILQQLVVRSRAQSGREWLPTFGVMDSQSVKTTNASEHRGIDGGKKNKRQKEAYCD
jgi:putative transposase